MSKVEDNTSREIEGGQFAIFSEMNKKVKRRKLDKVGVLTGKKKERMDDLSFARELDGIINADQLNGYL